MQTKNTDAKSMSVKLIDLEKLKEHAKQQGKVPIFSVTIHGEKLICVFEPWHELILEAIENAFHDR